MLLNDDAPAPAKGIQTTLSNIGTAYLGLDNNQEALKYQLRSLAIAEEMEDKKAIAMVSNNLGNIHQGDKTFILTFTQMR